jgi:hypothetical protein
MVRSTDCLSTERTQVRKVKPEKQRRLGTHSARDVVDTKGKVLFARTTNPQLKNRERRKKPGKKEGV